MVITKGSVAAKIFKEILVSSKTQKATTVPTSVTFVKNEGYYVKFDSNISSIFINDKNVSETFTIEGCFVVSVICAGLDNGDVTIDYKDSKAYINGVKFETSSNCDDDKEEDSEFTPHLTFTKEQLINLEKDFDISLGNFFKIPETTDTIVFGINEGSIYEYSMSGTCWKLTKLTDKDAVINAVKIEQDYGHNTIAWTIPHKVFNFMKISENVEIQLECDNRVCVRSEDFKLSFNSRVTRVNLFKKYLQYFSDSNSGDNDVKEMHISDEAKKFISDITHNFYEQEEDININMKFTKGTGLDINIDDNVISFKDENVQKDVNFEVDIFVIAYLINNNPEDLKVIIREDNLVEFFNDKSIYIVPNNI